MITSGQQRFINGALPLLRRDKRIVGVALGGSYIDKDTMDEYSWLDFIIAINPADVDEVMRERVALAEKLGVLLASFTGEHISRPNLLICLYDEPILHVDLHFVSADSASYREDDPVILYEEGATLSSQYAAEPKSVRTPDMQWCEDRFWIWIHYAATRAGSGELFDVLESLSFLRANVLGPLIQMKNGALARGVRNIERDSPQDVPALAATLAEYNRKDCIRALKAASDLYISLRGINKSHLYLREKAEIRALQYLAYISEKFE
jgi:hypothetical protein